MLALSKLADAWGQKGERLKLGHLRVLRPLLTPEARAKALPLLLPTRPEKIDLKGLDAAVARIVHDMWVDWHWTAENKYIHSAVRMHLPAISPAFRIDRNAA